VSLGERVTPNKLLDAWKGKGPPTLRVKGVTPPNLTQDRCERLIIHLLLKGFIKEEFHFTPYSTISYVVKGTRADMVMRGLRVKMDLRATEMVSVSKYLQSDMLVFCK
jgi:ATP-dependent DNA helicase Q1